MLISFTVGNHLSFNAPKTLSLSAVPTCKEHHDDNVFAAGKEHLLKSAVIYGANAGGKSNIVKAIGNMKRLVINSSKDIQKGESLKLVPFALCRETHNKPSRFEVVFMQKDRKYRYGFEADSKKVVSEWLFFSEKIKENPLFIRENDNIEVFDKYEGGHGLEERTRDNALFLSICAQFNVEIAENILFWFQDFNIISDEEEYPYPPLGKLSDDRTKSPIIDMIKKADLSINNIEIINYELKAVKLLKNDLLGRMPVDIEVYSAHNMYDEKGKVSGETFFDFFDSESRGTQKYFSLSGLIIDTLKRGKVMVIDELDASLHPLLTQQIIKLFNSKTTNPNNGQIIFTTHDTNLLSANIFRRDQIWFVEKDRVEATDLYSLIEYKLPKGKVRNDASFEKDYVMGRYGAIPFLGDFESMWSE